MYIVIDTSNLNNANGYMEYTAGTATSVPWSGVTDKPSIPTKISDLDNDTGFISAHPNISLDNNTTSTASPNHGESFTVIDSVTKDSNGHVTKVNTKTVTLPADTKISQSYSTDNHEYPILISDVSGVSSTSDRSDSGAIINNNLYVNPSTGSLYANKIYINGSEITSNSFGVVDTALSSTSENALQNKVITSELAGKADISHVHDASEITTGTIGIARLPAGALERLVTVNNQTARYLLTSSDVQIGDTIKQIDTGVMYLVVDTSNLDNSAGYMEYTAGTATSVPWSGVTDKPTLSTVATSGSYNDLTDKPTSLTPSSHSHGNITNDGKVGSTANKPLITTTNGEITTGTFGTSANTFCEGNDSRLSDARTPLAHTHSASDISGTLSADNIPNLDASKITSGTIDIARLPAGALERLVTVNNQTARYNLTTTDVQLGDVVKQSDTGVMYYVVDTTNLNNSAGYVEFTAGTATSVPWSGVTGKPSTYTPSSHSHTVSEISDFPTLSTVATSGSYNDLTNKPSIPSKTSDLTNDSHVSITTETDTTSTGTPVHGGTFTCIDSVTRDSNGHVTKVNTKTVTLPSDNNTDTLVTQNVSTANENHPILLTETKDATTNQGAKTSIFASAVKVNPSTGSLYATKLYSGGNEVLTSHQDISGKSDVGHTHSSSEVSGLSTVATSGSYNDLTNKPTSMTPTSHTHGNITNDGKIGSTANKPLITTTNGEITTGTFGTSANTFCEGNDSRLSDARTPTAHNHTVSEISDFPTLSTVATSGSYNDLTNKPSIPSKTSDLTNDSHVSITTETDTTSTGTPAHGGTFTCIDSVTRDSNGHVTKVNTKTVTLPSDNNTDTLVTQNVSTANENHPILLSVTKDATTNQGAKTSIFASGVKVNPSTGTVTASAFSGNLTGNVTGNLTGDVTGNSDTATNATNNANGKELTNTIIKGLSISGKTITYTQIDGNTGTLTTQDNNTDTKVTQAYSTTNNSYPVLLSNTAGITSTSSRGDTTAIVNNGIYANPSTGSLYATKLYSGGNEVLTSHQDISGKSDVGHTHTISDVTDFPTLSTVATSGSYNDLTNKPTSMTPTSHTHGNITNDGKVGTTANKPLITTTGGSVTTGSFGTSANTFCEGNDSRLSDARTPTAHNHSASEITSGTLNAARIPNLDASKITSGTIDIARLPAGALERLVTVNNQTARYALTTASVQNGDTVRQADTGIMYYVVDDTKLNSADGYVEYTAGTATSVPWSGITGKPSTFTPSSHSHTVSEISDFPTLSTVATSGSYNDLTNKPSIPSKTSELTNDSHVSITTSTDTTSTASPAHSGTFTCIDSVTRDTNGHVTKVNTKTVTLPSDNNTDTKVTQDYSTTNNSYPVLFSATAGITSTSSRGATTSIVNNGIYANPSTGSLYATKVYSGGNEVLTSHQDISGKSDIGHTHSSSEVSGLSTVATSGSYNDLTNKPTIPTVNNATLTIQKNGTTVKTFTANASSNVTANITVPTKTSELTNDSHVSITTETDTTSTGTPAHGGTFTCIDSVTRDSNGHVTKVNTKTITLPSDSNTDTLVTQNVSTANENHPILLSVTKDATTNQGAKTSIFASGVKVNPSTGTVTASAFSGNLTGNVTGNVSGSSGSCTGNSATATNATNATNNANGKELSNSIIKGLSISGTTITYTQIDGNTGTLTTQDNNTDTKVTQAYSTTNNSYPVLFSATAGITSTSSRGATTAIVNNGIYVNPSTGSLYATKLYSGGNEVLTSHQSLSNYVTINGTETITGAKTFNEVVSLGNGSGIYFNRTSLTKGTNPTSAVYYGTTRVRDGAETSFYLSRGGINTSGDNIYRNILTSWGSTATGGIEYGISSDGSNKWFTPYTNGDTTLGNSSNRWSAVYANSYYLGTTAFGDIVTHNASEFLTAHPTISTSTDTTSTGTPAHGGTFTCIDSVTRDSNGHVTKVNTKTITLPSDNNTDTLVTQNVSTTNATYPLLLCPTANATSNQGAKTSIFAKSVKINPSTNVISASGFSGPLTGDVTGNVSGSSGSCTGNSATATNATNNANGKELTNTIIKGLSISGKTITYTQIDGTTGTLTTQDNNTDTLVTQNVSTANENHPILLSVTKDATTNQGAKTSIFASGVKVNPSTNTVTASAFSGNLTGNVTGNLTGDVTGNCSGTSANVTGTVAIANGGTGATTRLGAVKNLTNENVGTSATYFYGMTNSWGKAGYVSVANAKTVLGITGDIVSHNASEFLTTHPTISTSTDTTSTASPTHSGTFTCVDSVTRDGNGHVTAINTKTVTLPADSNTDTLVKQNVSTTNNTYPVLFCATANATSNQGAKETYFGSNVKINPSTGALYATKLYNNGVEVLTSHQDLSNYVTLNGTQTITGAKTISTNLTFSTDRTRGTAPTKETRYFARFIDSAGHEISALANIYYANMSNYVALYAYNTTVATGNNIGNLGIGCDSSGNVYTKAPTPATTDNSTQIATTAFVKAQGYLTEHPSITTSADTTSTASPAHSGTFTCIDSVTRDTNGHVTTLNTKTVTLPAQYTHPTTAGNKHIPSGGASGQILKYSSAGTVTWSDTNFTRTLKNLGSRTTEGTWTITCLADTPVYIVGNIQADYVPGAYTSVSFDNTTIYSTQLGNGRYNATSQELNRSMEIMILAISNTTKVKVNIAVYAGGSFDSISLTAYQ